MDPKMLNWQDDDGWATAADAFCPGKVAMSLHDNEGQSICHVVAKERMGGILFGLMCLASPDHPKAGEFWIVEVEGARRVVQVQDNPTSETLAGEVKFIARIPLEAQ